jgi:hypothetical protein
MNNCSRSVVSRLRSEFASNPVGFRVVLPDGTLARVVQVSDTDAGKLYKVRGLDERGKFRALVGVSSWYAVEELRLQFYSVHAREVGA